MTKTIILASHNPVKVQATLHGFQRMFTAEEFILNPVTVPSGVPDQPLSDQQTLQGALNRVRNAQQAVPDADYWVGIEGGIEDRSEPGGSMLAFAWVAIRSNSLASHSRTGAFTLPEPVAQLVRQGKELGEADDTVFDRVNSKQETGAVGILTGDVITRESLYEHAVILALAPFKQEEFYLTADDDPGSKKDTALQ